jgi:hypothetical protein
MTDTHSTAPTRFVEKDGAFRLHIMNITRNGEVS